MNIEIQHVNKEEKNWPPTAKDFEWIAQRALKKSNLRDFKVLVYWNQPNIIMFEPVHYAQTQFFQQVYQSYDKRRVNVIIGLED